MGYNPSPLEGHVLSSVTLEQSPALLLEGSLFPSQDRLDLE